MAESTALWKNSYCR